MFERYLSEAITTHFGHVIENMDNDKVRISAWSGEVVLADLKLRKNALETFLPDCPIEIAHGSIGNLELKIPWKLFRMQLKSSQSAESSKLFDIGNCSIVLSDVNIVITPKHQQQPTSSDEDELQTSHSDEGESLEDRRAAREQTVQNLLDAKLLQRVHTSSTTADRWQWIHDYFTSMLASLTVTLRDIHVRYEDPGSTMGFSWTGKDQKSRAYRPSFAIGVTLRCFVVKNNNGEIQDGKDVSREADLTDDKKEAPESNQAEEALFLESFSRSSRVASAEAVSIYWDSRCQLISTNVNKAYLSVNQNEYYSAAFEVLQCGSSPGFVHEHLYKEKHSYLLNPVSPSAQLDIISSLSTTEAGEFMADKDIDNTSTYSPSRPPKSSMTPPSTIAIDFPMCKVTIARNTLEDMTYLRKSISVWSHATKGLLSRESVTRLARMRPTGSINDDPRAWWIFACKATLVLHRVGWDGTNLDIDKHIEQRKRRWLGLVDAVRRRRRYVELYKKFINADDTNERDHHMELLAIEDELTVEETVAFRLSVYEYLKLLCVEAHEIQDATATTAASKEGPNSSNQGKQTPTPTEIPMPAHTSHAYRRRIVNEMIQIVRRELINDTALRKEQRRQSLSVQSTQMLHSKPSIAWDVSLTAGDFTIQVNDEAFTTSRRERHSRILPIIQLSSSSSQKLKWYQDGSWDAHLCLSSLVMKDMTDTYPESDHEQIGVGKIYPYLVCHRQPPESTTANDDTPSGALNGEPGHQSITIVVSRKLEWNGSDWQNVPEDTQRGSTTNISVRIMPLRIVYATIPFEALTRVLNTVKTPELADDYQRMASVVADWQSRQKERLFQTLAHHSKKIEVHVDVGSPEVIIPENLNSEDSAVVLLDLGRLRFTNMKRDKLSDKPKYDDQWSLLLSDVQVRCTSRSNIHVALVEPFSIEFDMWTKLAGDFEINTEQKSLILMNVVLPRLAFNITTSSLQVVSRLQEQWKRRKEDLELASSPPTPTHPTNSTPGTTDRRQIVFAGAEKENEDGRIPRQSRLLIFQFSAPFISLRLANDIDFNLSSDREEGMPLFHLFVRGINGSVVQDHGKSTTNIFEAKLSSVVARDLYQTAGDSFELMMSSIPPELLLSEPSSLHQDPGRRSKMATEGWQDGHATHGRDLVKVRHESVSSDTSLMNQPDKLSIEFHELYIEWNPETLAAIQRALNSSEDPVEPTSPRRTLTLDEMKSLESSEDSFCDAVEDEFFDANSHVDTLNYLSDVDESGDEEFTQDSFFDLSSAAPHFLTGPFSATLNPKRSLTTPRLPTRQSTMFSSFTASAEGLFMPTKGDTDGGEKPPKSLDCSFTLSTLRVSFNKEARHRKLMIARMDATSIKYSTRPGGGSRTTMSLGNLVFSDPASGENATLYSQVLGLQTDDSSVKNSSASSLLHMEILINPSSKRFVDDLSEYDGDLSKGVFIDRLKGQVAGCNCQVIAKFSPMRFVFLQQLWFEIIDYFFEGVLGAEVWGGKGGDESPLPVQDIFADSDEEFMPGSSAEGFSFTRFDIVIESPTILLPVAYRSTQFIRLEMNQIAISNLYSSCSEESATYEGLSTNWKKRLQWYNNVTCSMHELKIFSWCGRELSMGGIAASIHATWPVGSYGFLIIPKWRVSCSLEALIIELRRTDYALLQHIITYNIGEVSRHQEEWDVLQSLTPSALAQYNESIFVHFAYDNKDVIPTTYSVTTDIKLLKFVLRGEETNAHQTLAIASCSDLIWKMTKEKDHISRQNVACNISLLVPVASFGDPKYKPLLLTKTGTSGKDNNQQSSQSRDFRYTSSFEPTNDSAKMLEIAGGTIYMVVSSWMRFARFFQSLPEAEMLTAGEVQSSIQVGDRWYRIGTPTDLESEADEGSNDTKSRFPWLHSQLENAASSSPVSLIVEAQQNQLSNFQFHLLLISPRIVLSAGSSDTSSQIVLGIQHLEYLHHNNDRRKALTRSLFLHGLEVYTFASNARGGKTDKNSLIHPLNILAVMEQCNKEDRCRCDTHSVRISADTIKARAAYSDFLIAVDVLSAAVQDFRLSSTDTIPRTSERPPSKTANAHVETAQNDTDADTPVLCPSLTQVDCAGLQIHLVDDSGRHFAGRQELLILSLKNFFYFHRAAHKQIDSNRHVPTASTYLRLQSLNLIDCLQPLGSRFRLVASSHASGHSADRKGDNVHQHDGDYGKKSSIDWNTHRLRWDSAIGFSHSKEFLERSKINESVFSYNSTEGRHTQKDSELIEIQRDIIGNISHHYYVRFRRLSIQWNPSTVIAIQRFLGRIKKATHHHVAIISPNTEKSEKLSPIDDVPDTVPAVTATPGTTPNKFAVIDLEELTACLNKEHQFRRLLEVTLSQCKVTAETSNLGLSLRGQLGNLFAVDIDGMYREPSTIPDGNRMVLQVMRKPTVNVAQPPFLTISYTRFATREPEASLTSLPKWISSRMSNDLGIDDYLSVSIATMRFVYLRDRTEEILDYLSNGLPGKGMGATSKAAKGFISKRIVTRSFLDLTVDSPHVLVPENVTVEKGISLKLGDVIVHSWFDVDTESRQDVGSSQPKLHWKRVLSLTIEGQSGGTYQHSTDAGLQHFPCILPHNLSLVLERPIASGSTLNVRCDLSFIECSIKYTEYCLIRATLRDNVGSSVDKKQWDNVEKAYWLENVEGDDADPGDFHGSPSKVAVEYSSNARFVRYGKNKKDDGSLQRNTSLGSHVPTPASSTAMEFRLQLDGLSLRLHRNDPILSHGGLPDGMDALCYDIIVLSVQNVEASAKVGVDKHYAFNLSLFRIGLFDLGDSGRLLRDSYESSRTTKSRHEERAMQSDFEARSPCPFAVIAEGYSPPASDDVLSADGKNPPQFVMNVEKCTTSSDSPGPHQSDSFNLPSGSDMVVARIGLHYLTVHMLVRPLQEMADFLTCSWENDDEQPSASIDELEFVDNDGAPSIGEPSNTDTDPSSRAFHLKIVAHYPRIFFLANESDPHSRALVLKGLAIVKGGKIHRIADSFGSDDPGARTTQRVSVVDAQLQSMESYINPDVYEALQFKKHHYQMIGEIPESVASFYNDQPSASEQSMSDSLGIALIQPVTSGIEFCQTQQALFPTQRVLSVNIEPVSTMLSFEDLGLIEVVLKRWSSEPRSTTQRSRRSSTRQPAQLAYTVTFEHTRLGLGLKNTQGNIQVDSVQDENIQSLISVGDKIMKVDGVGFEHKSLEELVRYLTSHQRPTIIEFMPAGSSTASFAFRSNKRLSSQAESRNFSALSNFEMQRLNSFFTTHFRRGVPHGLYLEQSAIGEFAVVRKVGASFDIATKRTELYEGRYDVEVHNFHSFDAVRTPQSGAIILAIDGNRVEDMGYAKATELLSNLSSKESQNWDAGGVEDAAMYGVTFIEVDSLLLGNVDTVEFSAADITLAFIDDLRGRDMPLFRGSVRDVEVHAKRGLGVKVQNIDAASPTVLNACHDPVVADELERILTLRDFTGQMKSDQVVAVSMKTLCSLDYFHPKIAVWEPFLESSRFFLHLERQEGSHVVSRAGQLAVEISDSPLPGNALVRSSTANETGMMTLNLSDTAAEVLSKAIDQWREWRDSTKADKLISREIVPMGTADKESFVKHTASPNKQHPNLAAQHAAQAALAFAQKRGADSSKKSESAKPFIFRNRSGVSIAFAHQGKSKHTMQESEDWTAVGDYNGMDKFAKRLVTIVADQEEARFDMETIVPANLSEPVLADSGSNLSAIHGSNKVRNYDGHFPSITVAIQTLPGISLQPVENLRVHKVGSFIRYLSVMATSQSTSETTGAGEYKVPLVWRVEIDDNRRVLTLSSAVRVMSACLDTSIAIGIKSIEWNDDKWNAEQDEGTIAQIGVSSSDEPFYLPLWLPLKFEAVQIHVKPCVEGNHFWSEESILDFGLYSGENVVTSSMEKINSRKGEWRWNQSAYGGNGIIRCGSKRNSERPVWLACLNTKHLREHYASHYEEERVRGAPLQLDEGESKVLSVAIDSCMTIRNMLPMGVEWEMTTQSAIHGSPGLPATMNHNDRSERTKSSNMWSTSEELRSGEYENIFACNCMNEAVMARFRCIEYGRWTDWTGLSMDSRDAGQQRGRVPQQKYGQAATQRESLLKHVEIQITDSEFGRPLTIGLRISPKLASFAGTTGARNELYGLEVNLYSAFWIRNLTTLPLNFGCPMSQIIKDSHAIGLSVDKPDKSAARMTAESALMELSSVLEFGDKGTGLGKKHPPGEAEVAKMYSIPQQDDLIQTEEIFEYVEIENSTVQRRWWASQDFQDYRDDITHLKGDGDTWSWLDDRWKIDCSGRVDPSTGGWESCRNLLAGFGSFNLNRNFDRNHAFRRRRWFRSREKRHAKGGNMLEGIQAFHHPLNFSSLAEKSITQQPTKPNRGQENPESKRRDVSSFKISVKVGDGKWSIPASIPASGTCHGVLRVFESRWPSIKTQPQSKSDTPARVSRVTDKENVAMFGEASLNSGLSELCYTISDVQGEWGDFSRLMNVSPRFMVRNDSKKYGVNVKQTGSPDVSSLHLLPGEAKAFYWADFRLPGLVSLRPEGSASQSTSYTWSGGFDICNLGMAPIRIRSTDADANMKMPEKGLLRSFRVLVEIRPSTGGFGINVSFREEDQSGDGALFRIENSCPFPIWIAQDDVLANPRTNVVGLAGEEGNQDRVDQRRKIHGDFVRGGQNVAYALDVPYRQGKYVHRKAATMPELLRVRLALAPLTSRPGVESVKVIGLTNVGQSIRLNPSKLVSILPSTTREKLATLRVLGLIVNDGPTRVLKFRLIKKSKLENVFENPFVEVSYMDKQRQQRQQSEMLGQYAGQITDGAELAIEMKGSQRIPSEDEAKRSALSSDADIVEVGPDLVSSSAEGEAKLDQVYSFRGAFNGFLVSLIDNAPSEIGVVVLKNVNVLSRWNSKRTTDASALLSVGWLQIDNHVPNAPFPVAFKPALYSQRRDRVQPAPNKEGIIQSRPVESDEAADPSDIPFLLLGLSFAPKHKSGIVCLHSVTVAPRNIAIAVDLAFIVRVRQFFASFSGHLEHKSDIPSSNQNLHRAVAKGSVVPPVFRSEVDEIKRAAAIGVENIKFYFEELTVIPFTVTLSVAPAKALTSAQASLEGIHAAAIHQAVRKGDVLLGNSNAGLGVKIGKKNTTSLAVVRGVFKSIVVDALLRLDGASLNLAGISLRNHISTGPQLLTYLSTHYLASLRQNMPALIGSLAAFGNPLGLIRGVGEGMSDFVTEPVKGLQKSVQELDPGYLLDGVARGTESLARHTVGGFADSASLLTETFSKNMAVLTLDRRYAQKRDRGISLKSNMEGVTLASGVESGFYKLVQGFKDGMAGVVKAPMRGAERRGVEGFAKGMGKGLLGLLVKPMIGISDAATDVMIGVKSTVDHSTDKGSGLGLQHQIRPRRPMYGRDKILQPYVMDDAAAFTLMLRTRLGGENYLSHIEMKNRVALFSIRGMLVLGPRGQELLAVKYKHVAGIEIRPIQQENGSPGFGVIILLNAPRRNGSEVEVLCFPDRGEALELSSHLRRGVNLVTNDLM